MIHVHDVEQGTSEWLALRAGKYTGANAHKLLRYGAVSHALTEQSSFGGNYYTKRGHILEDEAVELYEAIKKRHVQRPGFVTNDKYPTCGYSPDGLAEATLIEVKCFKADRHLAIYRGDIPFTVLAQIHFGLLITELKTANLLIYNPELEPKLALKIIEIKANRNIASNFKRILREEAHAL